MRLFLIKYACVYEQILHNVVVVTLPSQKCIYHATHTKKEKENTQVTTIKHSKWIKRLRALLGEGEANEANFSLHPILYPILFHSLFTYVQVPFREVRPTFDKFFCQKSKQKCTQ